MTNNLRNLINTIFENHVKPMNINSETQEQGYCEWNDAIPIIQDVLQSEYVGELLHLFWQRQSDACPLSVPLCEKECDDFREWVNKIEVR